MPSDPSQPVPSTAAEVVWSSPAVRHVLDSMSDLFVAYDRDLRIVFVNRALAALSPAGYEGFVGKTQWELWPDMRGTIVEEAFAAALATGQPQAFEYRYPAADVWVDVRIYPSGDFLHVYFRNVTERKRAELASGEREADLRSMIDAIPQIAWAADFEARPTYFNARWYEFTGMERGSLYDMGAYVHPDDLPRVLAVRRPALERGEPCEYQVRILNREGKYRWHLSRFVPQYDGAGAIVRWLGTSTDIHDQRTAAQAVVESEARLRQMVDSVPDIAWTARPDGFWDHYNERWFEYTGRDREWEAEADWSSALHPDDVAPTFGAWRRSLETGESLEIESRLLGGDGQYRWFLTRARPLRDDDGAIVRWFGTTTDIHDQRARQEALSLLMSLTEATRELLDPAQIMAVSTRMLGTYLGASRCAYAEVQDGGESFDVVHDWSPELPSTVGRHEPEAFGEEVGASLLAGHTLVLSNVKAEVAPEGRSGFEEMQIEAIVCCPLIKEGRLEALMAVHQAVPRQWTPQEIELIEMVVDRSWSSIERARAEARLRELNEELERKVRERTAELEAAAAEMESFTYSVSHDLRAPLRAINATARMMEEDFGERLPEDAKRMLHRQAQSAQRLGELIDELLKMSRLQRLEMRRERIDLADIAREVVSDLDRSVRCAVTIEEGLWVWADQRLIRFVVGNLIENAVKFSPEGGEARFGRALTAKGEAFYVRDEGIGFDMAYAHKLFLPFERLVTESEFPGTGIGLANVQRIVQRHGGEVWAESEPGKGAIFWFTLG